MATTKNLGDVIRKWLREDPELASRVETESINAHIARQIFEYRTAAQLTQDDLAQLVGTKQPAIARMEDADYEGHSIPALKRIADALGCDLRVEFYKKPQYTLVGQTYVYPSQVTNPQDVAAYTSEINVTVSIGSS